MSVKDGGAAFPRPIGNNGAAHFEDREVSAEEVGMSLRDYFAAQALPGFITQYAQGNPVPWCENIAQWCYAYADAMLRERERQS
jgi:hypothetical protein